MISFIIRKRLFFITLCLFSSFLLSRCVSQNQTIPESYIEKNRQEVKETPTNSGNIKERVKILIAWIEILFREGADVESVFSREENQELKKMIDEKKLDQACQKTDEIYGKLENLAKNQPVVEKQKELPSREVIIPVNSDKVKIIKALPEGEKGVNTGESADFTEITSSAEKGLVKVNLSSEPVWIIEGDLPRDKSLSPEKSPFGFHPASAYEDGYKYAQDIGVTWDRGGFYFLWAIAQPDLTKKIYDWSKYDRYFLNVPDGFELLKNITVCMVERPGSPELPADINHPKIESSQYLEGTTYRPKDTVAYSEWVKATVERYDGDGIDDMQDLPIPAKYWQVDNEPPRGREGYVDLVHITSKAIKEADPEAKVLIGGLVLPCGNQATKTYEKNSLPLIKGLEGKDIDIFDFHWFGLSGEWYLLPDAMKRIRKDLNEAGFENVPIWFAEMGTYSGTPLRGRNQSEREQASEMVKRYTVALGEGVEKIFWAWGMREGFKNVNDNDFFDNTGFVYDGIGPEDSGKGIKKIIYWSYKNMTYLLHYWDGSLPEKIDSRDGIMAYRFKFKGENRGIVITWLYK